MPGLETDPSFFAVVVFHELRLHFDCLDDFPKNGGAGRLTGLDRFLGVRDGPDGAIEQTAFFFQYGALHAQRFGKLERVPVEQDFDLLQRESDKLEGDDLFEAREILFDIDPVAGVGPAGLQ